MSEQLWKYITVSVKILLLTMQQHWQLINFILHIDYIIFILLIKYEDRTLLHKEHRPGQAMTNI